MPKQGSQTAVCLVGCIPRFGLVSIQIYAGRPSLDCPHVIIYCVSALVWHCVAPSYLQKLCCHSVSCLIVLCCASAVTHHPHADSLYKTTVIIRALTTQNNYRASLLQIISLYMVYKWHNYKYLTIAKGKQCENLLSSLSRPNSCP